MREAFEADSLPADCWVRKTVSNDRPNPRDLIDVVSEYGGRNGLIRRLRDEHPTEGQHHPQHDARMLDVFSEAEAFAWAAVVAGLGEPRFVFEQGRPDIEAGGVWIEAKTVNMSDKEIAETRKGLKEGGGSFSRSGTVHSPHPRFVAKFADHLTKALSQRDEVEGATAGFTTFFELTGVDFRTSRDEARVLVSEWATAASQRYDVRIVIAHNYHWRTADEYLPGETGR